MALGSIIGFGLVFVLIAWTGSALAAIALSVSAERLKARGSAGEKRAYALALVLPPLLGLIVALGLALYSLYASLGGADHCSTHGHHLHLCLVHGGEWSSRAWAMALISGLSALALVRIARLVETTLTGRRRLRAVERSSVWINNNEDGSYMGEDGTNMDEVPIFRAPSHRPFCFVTGFRSPRIFVASSLWDQSSAEERGAMLAHEHGHIENGDLWRSSALSFFALFGAPILAAGFKRRWRAATERLCDRIAADRTGDSATVASALVNMIRTPRIAAVMSFAPSPGSVEERVVAVLNQNRVGRAVANKLLQAGVMLIATSTVTTVALADPFHHALERLFSLI